MQDYFEYRTEHSIRYINENMPSLIEKFSKENERQFLCGNCCYNEISIGIEKGDHAGYWYIATLEECPEGTKIKGNIKYDPEGFTKSRYEDSLIFKICFWCFSAILYIIFCIPLLINLLIGVITKRKSKEEYLDMFMRDYLQCEKIEASPKSKIKGVD